jgi:anti-sigma factor RsiW
MTEFLQANSRGSGHPSDEDLLCLLDAELPPAELERIRSHLAGCDACKAQLAALKEVLGSIQEIRDSAVGAVQAQQTDEVVEVFRAGLEQHVREKTPARVHVKSAREIGRSWSLATMFRYRVPILASILAFALVLATTLALRETTVSADMLLSRSEQRDLSRPPAGSPVSRAVVHIRLLDTNTGREEAARAYVLLADNQAQQARLQTATQDPTFWSANGNNFWGTLSSKAFADHPFFAPAMLPYMQEQNFFPDAAAAQFRKLIANRGSSETHVRKGETSYGLDYVFAENHPSGIRDAVLWLSKETYDPFQLSIFAGNGTSAMEYRITRESPIFETRSSQDALLLSPSSNVPAVAPNAAPVSRSPVMAPLKYAQIPASASEVRATELLHRLNACLGEEVYVYPMPDGSTVVQGLVESSERRKVLMSALTHSDSTIRPEIFTPDQLRSGVHLFASPYEDLAAAPAKNEAITGEQSADLSGRQIAFRDELVASFQSDGKTSDEARKLAAAYSSELSSLSEKVLLHSWALERLDAEFPISRTAELAKPELDTLSAIGRDHRQQIRELVRHELSLLARIPVSESLPKTQITPTAQESLGLAKEQEKLVRALFTASQQNTRKSEGLSRLLQLLHQLEN